MSYCDAIFRNAELFMKLDILSNWIVGVQINRFFHIDYSSLNAIKTTIINIEYRTDYEFEYFYET